MCCGRSAAGLGIGAALGTLIGKLVVYFRSRYQESVGLDEFLAVGLITLAYGIAVLAHAYGFLAVFAAGLALQRVKEPEVGKHRVATRPAARKDTKTLDPRATHPEYASAYMRQAVLGFNEQLGRIGEVAVVLLVGAMLATSSVWFVLLVFVLVRPLSVWLGLLGAPISSDQHNLISWFGIRGIGSIYYLMYAINHELPRPLADQIIAITLATVTVSIVLHGISVTPLMHFYAKRKAGRSSR